MTTDTDMRAHVIKPRTEGSQIKERRDRVNEGCRTYKQSAFQRISSPIKFFIVISDPQSGQGRIKIRCHKWATIEYTATIFETSTHWLLLEPNFVRTSEAANTIHGCETNYCSSSANSEDRILFTDSTNARARSRTNTCTATLHL